MTVSVVYARVRECSPSHDVRGCCRVRSSYRMHSSCHGRSRGSARGDRRADRDHHGLRALAPFEQERQVLPALGAYPRGSSDEHRLPGAMAEAVQRECDGDDPKAPVCVHVSQGIEHGR